MGLAFEFSTSQRIIFGSGSFGKIPSLIKETLTGKSILLVTGNNPGRYNDLSLITDTAEWSVTVFNVSGEPALETIKTGLSLARQSGCSMVIGLGGGSVIDCAKAIAALATNDGDPLDFLEVIGKGKSLVNAPLTFIAVPTTAGTGAEVTKNAVIHSTEHQVKVSLRSANMFPGIALVDPSLTITMSPKLTAYTGLDAFTHLLESFVSNQSNAFVDNICREGLQLIGSSLPRVYADGNDMAAREKMSLASLLGGMALANVRLGAVHGFAGPIGGMFAAPHGAVCASLLPAVFETNLRAVTDLKMEEYLRKFNEIGVILTGKKQAGASDALNHIKNLSVYLQIPGLSEFGITEGYFPELVSKAKNASSMKGNPVPLSDDDLFRILEESV